LQMFQDAHLTTKLSPLKAYVVGDVGKTLWVLMGSIGLVLLVACANVANLLLVRVEGRRQELAVRSALGAGRGRIAAELMFESVGVGADWRHTRLGPCLWGPARIGGDCSRRTAAGSRKLALI